MMLFAKNYNNTFVLVNVMYKISLYCCSLFSVYQGCSLHHYTSVGYAALCVFNRNLAEFSVVRLNLANPNISQKYY